MFDNLKCLLTDFPIDIFLLLFLPLLALWWYLNSRIRKQSGTIVELRGRVDFLEKELEACRKAKLLINTTTPTPTTNTFITTAEGNQPIENKKDDLKIVEGIGPKIEELLYKRQIFTFQQLANTPTSTLKEILEKAGARFQMHDPTTWPAQAALASEDKWDELKKWQDELHKGRLS